MFLATGLEISPLAAILICFFIWAVADFLWYNVGHKGLLRLPFIGNLHQIIWNYTTFHDYAYTTMVAHNLKVLTLKLGTHVIVHFIVHPKDVEHLLKVNWKNYTVSTGLRGDAFEEVFGNGIFRADGAHWYLQRKHTSREFSANNFRDTMTAMFITTSNKLAENLLEAISKPVDLHESFFRLTLDSFGMVAFGTDFGLLSGKPLAFAKAFDRSQEIVARRVATKAPFFWKFQRLLQVGSEKQLSDDLKIINEFVCDLIRKRRAEKDETRNRDDLLSKLITVCETDEELNSQSDSYLRDMTVNFIIAGRDTTACCLSWFFYELCKNPSVEQKLLEELENVLNSRVPNFDDLGECHYLMSCLSETLRLHPSVPLNLKTALQPDVLPYSGIKVSPGDSVSYLPYTMGRMEFLWGKDAKMFRPERWLDEEGVFQREDQCKFTAFQAGPRICLGMDMAMLEMKVVVAILLRKFQFRLIKEPRYRVGIVLQMFNGLWVEVTRRQEK